MVFFGWGRHSCLPRLHGQAGMPAPPITATNQLGANGEGPPVRVGLPVPPRLLSNHTARCRVLVMLGPAQRTKTRCRAQPSGTTNRPRRSAALHANSLDGGTHSRV